jgi:hypothetical protein
MTSLLPTTTAVRRPAPPLNIIAARAASATNSSARPAAPMPSVAPSAGTEPGKDDDGFGFRDILSMLNPLQYLPVVGSIYRALTGDKIPDAVREIGSLAVSFATGGPIGVAISAAVSGLEKLTGVTSDEMATTVLAGLGIISDPDQPQLAAAEPAPRPMATDGRFVPWSRAQRSAYGAAAPPALTIPAPSRHADIPAPMGVTTAIETARRQAASAAYARRTLQQMEPMIRERIIGHSA